MLPWPLFSTAPIRPSGSLNLTALVDLSTRELERMLEGRFLVVDARMRGLDDGLLNDRSERPVSTIEDGWGCGTADNPWAVPLRSESSETTDAYRRSRNAFPAHSRWRETYAMPCRISLQGDIETWLVVEKRPGGGEGEQARAIAPESQPLANHQERTAAEAARIVRQLEPGGGRPGDARCGRPPP